MYYGTNHTQQCLITNCESVWNCIDITSVCYVKIDQDRDIMF